MTVCIGHNGWGIWTEFVLKKNTLLNNAYHLEIFSQFLPVDQSQTIQDHKKKILYRVQQNKERFEKISKTKENQFLQINHFQTTQTLMI